MTGGAVSPGDIEDPVLPDHTGSLPEDNMTVTSPIPGPHTDDDSLKLRLLLPHLALASFLVLLAVASFIHYHFANKENKADSKFTEELRAKLRRPRAAQGFPSTLVQYFGLTALDTNTFDFTAYLHQAATSAPSQHAYRAMHDQQRARPAVCTVAPSGARPYSAGSHDKARYGLTNYGFVEDEFRDYNQRSELTMMPQSLVDSPLPVHRDAGSFQTKVTPAKPEVPARRVYRVALNPGGLRKT